MPVHIKVLFMSHCVSLNHFCSLNNEPLAYYYYYMAPYPKTNQKIKLKPQIKPTHTSVRFINPEI